MYYLTLEIDADDQKEAEKVAEGIADTVGAKIMATYPDFQIGFDNDGQAIIYTGYIDERHGQRHED
jgi:hypothetical protein